AMSRHKLARRWMTWALLPALAAGLSLRLLSVALVGQSAPVPPGSVVVPLCRGGALTLMAMDLATGQLEPIRGGGGTVDLSDCPMAKAGDTPAAPPLAPVPEQIAAAKSSWLGRIALLPSRTGPSLPARGPPLKRIPRPRARAA
ncbi:MAG: hypothetical protein AAF713_12905, partial [Pseudomonadota bacterium]